LQERGERNVMTLTISGILLLAGAVVDPAAVVVPGAIAFFDSGQSNAAGRGELLAEDTSPELGVYVLRKDGRAWTGAEPYDYPSPTGGVGTTFQRSFARRLLAEGYAPQIWLVHCAVSGTPITRWTGEQVPAGTSLAIKNAGGVDFQLCMQLAAQLVYLGVRFEGVLWHQGESGCNAADMAAAHESRLRMIRDRFRAWFPGIVFIGGELAESYSCTYKTQVNAATCTASDACVSSVGLPTRDGTHFTRSALRELGLRYADAFFSCGGSPPL
jgi:hypothetical protein